MRECACACVPAPVRVCARLHRPVASVMTRRKHSRYITYYANDVHERACVCLRTPACARARLRGPGARTANTRPGSTSAPATAMSMSSSSTATAASSSDSACPCKPSNPPTTPRSKSRSSMAGRHEHKCNIWSAVWQWDEDKRSPLSINLKPNMDAHILLRIKCTADYVQSNAPFGAGLRPTHTHPKHGEGPTMHSMRIQIECSTQAHWQMRCLSIQWRQKESTRCILHVQQMWCVRWVWWGWWVWWLWWWLWCL